jgi:hypothetical protein
MLLSDFVSTTDKATSETLLEDDLFTNLQIIDAIRSEDARYPVLIVDSGCPSRVLKSCASVSSNSEKEALRHIAKRFGSKNPIACLRTLNVMTCFHLLTATLLVLTTG